ncbi:MAG: dockerin type I domain-containing protein [Candidatus Bathyarchaeota archaeon]|jgi:hypothetical protein
MTTTKQLLITAFLVTSLALTTSHLLVQQANAQTARNITIANSAFTPENLIVPAGYATWWTNNDPVIHTLWFVNASDQSAYLLSDPIIPTEAWSHTFSEYMFLHYYDFDRLWIEADIMVTIPGDVNGDRTVDIFDIGTISAHWYPGPPVGPLGYSMNADINGDGSVDIFDIGITSAHWGQTW